MSSISRILLFMVSCVFTQNIVFVQLLGGGALYKKAGRIGTAAIVGAFMALVMTVASAVNWLVYRKVLVPLNAQSLALIAFVLVIAGAAALAAMLCKKLIPAAGEALGENVVALAANCAVLGVCVLSVGGGFGRAVASGLFGGLGFLLAMLLMAGVQDRLEFSKVPKSMRGLPISLVSASLIALAFMGFIGL